MGSDRYRVRCFRRRLPFRCFRQDARWLPHHPSWARSSRQSPQRHGLFVAPPRPRAQIFIRSLERILGAAPRRSCHTIHHRRMRSGKLFMDAGLCSRSLVRTQRRWAREFRGSRRASSAPRMIAQPLQISSQVQSPRLRRKAQAFPRYNVLIVEVIAMGLSEAYRTGLLEPAFDEIETNDPSPGGRFDPLGLAESGDLEELKIKELKHCRFAMGAWLGCIFQAFGTKEGPVANVIAHRADAVHVNILAPFAESLA